MNNLNSQAISNDAYQAIKPKLPSLRKQVLNAIVATGLNGATNEEIASVLPTGILYASINPRMTELSVRGFIRQNGYRRNSRGRKMIVWVATERATA